MIEKLKIELGEVQKTLLFPLWGRAKEFEEKNPLIQDRYAHDIINRIDFDFGQMTDLPVHLQINTSIRAYNFDLTLQEVIREFPDATIVNLGAGLDTTFQRVDNGKIFWYDLDLPDTMDLRRKLIPEGERNRCVAKSLFDRSWFADVKVRGSKVFFMSSGVLVYLQEDDIRNLFLEMAREFPGSEIMFEIYSKKLLWLQNRSVPQQRREGKIVTQMNWGLSRPKSMERWSDRIKVMEHYGFYAKVNMNAHWEKKYLWPMKVIKRFGMIQMVRLRLG